MSIQNLYPNVKPSLLLDFANTKQLDPRITFTRASTGTYYDGKTVAKAEENLLTQSGNVAVWSQTLGVSRTGNSTTAPDGTITAGLVTVDSSTSRHFVGSQRGGVAAIGATITGSVFLKASTYGFAAVQLSNATVGANTPRYSISVDLSNGTIGGFTGSLNVSGQAASVVSVGNGWYRVILTMTTATAGDGEGMNILVTPMPTNGSGYLDGGAILPFFSGDGVSGIFVWGAQAELRSTVTAYTPTTTAPITNYIPVLLTAAVGVPRFEHNPVTGESLGLEIEEQRTNLLLRSEEFDNAAWLKLKGVAGSIPVVTANTSVAPDGTLTADTVVFVAPASGDQSVITQTPATSTGTYTGSFHVRATSAGDVGKIIAFRHVSTAMYTLITLTSSWQRATATEARSGDNFEITLRPAIGTSSGTVSVQLWGAQLEAGAFATSYIPTVASQVTRAPDSASMTGTNFSSWYTQGVGTLFAQASSVFPASGNFVASIADSGSSVNLIALTMTSGNPSVLINANGSTQTLTSIGSITLQQNVAFKISATYKTNYAYLAANGVSSPLISTLIVPIVSQLNIGVNAVGGQRINGTIARLAFYPRAFAATEQQAITI